MPSVRAFRVDAFTAERFTGNPATVVLDAEPLSAEQMRLLARELGNIDTAFVTAADATDHDLQVRFLTPHGEAPFIGHATLAVHAVLASIGSPVRPRQKQSNGLVRVERVEAGGALRFTIHQSPPQLREPLTAEALAALLQALALTPAELDPRCPPLIAGATGTRALLGLQEAAVLARVQPDFGRLTQWSQQFAAPGAFLFTLRPQVAGVWTEARMFCPAIGIPEDPVSGNAHALLGAHLLRLRLLPGAAGSATWSFIGAQGHHLQRPGRVTVTLTTRGEELAAVSISGEAVVVFATTVQL